MSDAERKALYEYLKEQRRHYIAQAKACEMFMMTLLPEQKVVYNTTAGNGAAVPVTTTPAPEFRE